MMATHLAAAAAAAECTVTAQLDELMSTGVGRCLQIVSSVQYCHQKHIVHRDLKVSRSRFSFKLQL